LKTYNFDEIERMKREKAKQQEQIPKKEKITKA